MINHPLGCLNLFLNSLSRWPVEKHKIQAEIPNCLQTGRKFSKFKGF